MNTEALIATLSREVRPLPRRPTTSRLIMGTGIGGIVTLALVAGGLGLRPDLGRALQDGAFWMKWAYTMALALTGLAMTSRLSRPEPVSLHRFWPVAVPIMLLAVVSMIELRQAPAGDRMALWLGRSWRICPWLLLAGAIPIFVGLLWSFRRLAPTRLRAAGAAAGLTAGACAATLYGLHCPEASATFVLTWYTLGILLAAVAGALLGPRLLRW